MVRLPAQGCDSRMEISVLRGIRSGDSRPTLDVRRGWLVILAFAIQAGTIPIISDPSALVLKKAILGVTAAMLLLGIVPNLRWWGFRLLGVGFLLNLAVMSANGGLMPITLEDYNRVSEPAADLVVGQTPPGTKNVLLAEPGIRLELLRDRLYISELRPNVYSVGDLMLLAGLAVFVIEVTSTLIRSRRRGSSDDVKATT